MADKKYIARTVTLTREHLTLLEKVRASLKERLGFEPSLAESIAAAAKRYMALEHAVPQFVYFVWVNDHLRGVYREGSKAEALLLDWKEKVGGTFELLPSDAPSDPDPFVQRWHQTDGSIARLAVEKEMVQ
jgi:hypothetical protein